MKQAYDVLYLELQLMYYGGVDGSVLLTVVFIGRAVHMSLYFN